MRATKPFSFISISLVYNKSDQHRNVNNSYNVKLAGKSIKTILLENTKKSYSSFDNVKFDLDEDGNQYQLYLQFVAWYCSSMVPLITEKIKHIKNYLTKKHILAILTKIID